MKKYIFFALFLSSTLAHAMDNKPFHSNNGPTASNPFLIDEIIKKNFWEVYILLEGGVDANECSADGRSPLDLAIRIKPLLYTNMLLNHGADPFQVTIERGKTKPKPKPCNIKLVQTERFERCATLLLCIGKPYLYLPSELHNIITDSMKAIYEQSTLKKKPDINEDPYCCAIFTKQSNKPPLTY